jgi:hypothetical protein
VVQIDALCEEKAHAQQVKYLGAGVGPLDAVLHHVHHQLPVHDGEIAEHPIIVLLADTGEV